MKEKQFIQKGARKVRLDEFLEEELEGAGYSHSDIVRTPTSTKVVIYAQRPGLVIGRGGSRINELTEDMEEAFDFENPQIEVNEIEDADANAEIVAKSIADWLQKGGHAKRVGYTYLRRMKEAGVIGAELEITGKLSGNRGRTEKFSFGYVKRCGNTSKKNVSKAYELARTKPGAIGVKVRIMESLPEFQHRKIDVQKEIFHKTISDEDAENRSQRIDEVIDEAENMTSAELERAIEDRGQEIETSDIDKSDVRDAFEAREEEEEVKESHEPEEDEEEDVSDDAGKESDNAESEEESADEERAEVDAEASEESEGDEAEYEEIVSGTIGDAKDLIDELEDPDYGAILQAEQADKNRTTFVDWLEARL